MSRKMCVLITIFIMCSIIVSGCSSQYVDMTTHKSVEFVLNSDNTYTMERNIGFFRGCPETIVIPETYLDKPVTSLGGIFSDFDIIYVIGSSNLKTIEESTFAHYSDRSLMNLKSVVFPENANLESIGRESFFNCGELELFVVPENFKSFGIGCFYACDNLTSLVIYNKTPPAGSLGLFADWRNEGFYDSSDVDFKVYVPDEAVESYKESSWGNREIRPISEISETLEYPIVNNYDNNDQVTSGYSSIGLIITLGVCVMLFVLLVMYLIIEYKNEKIVLEKSHRIKELIKLNQSTHFGKIQYCYNNHQVCNSKRQLDNLSFDDYLIGLISTYESFYRNIVEVISSNRSKYYSYSKTISTIKSDATEEYCQAFGFSLKKFLKFESRVFKRKRLRKPQFDVTIICKATYTSPQGRNHYWKEERYNFDELKALFDHTIELKAERQTRQFQIRVERAKMTDSLRYDILKRDNFRCQICGSTAQDGVKLHIDHIIPVAKGGLTTESNLRTLCDRCNMGKSDKM